MDITQLVALASGHKWLALIALVVGLLVRVFKDDTKIPGVIPKPARPWIALGLGLVLGTVQQRIAGAAWLDAVVSGALAGLLPIVAHKLGIEWLRDGKEVALPGLMKPSADDAATAKKKDDDDHQDPPIPPVLSALVFLVLALGLATAACSSTLRASTPRDVARGGVLLLVKAADEGDAVCAKLALDAKGSGDKDRLTKAVSLAETCAKAKAKVLDAADSAASALATWDAAAEGNLGCAAVRGLIALGDLRTAIQSFGGTIPAALDDGLTTASRLAHGAPSVCPGGK